MRCKVRWLSTVAVVCMLLVLMPDVALTRGEKMVIPSISYWSNEGSETLPLEMTVSEEGVGIVRMRSNRGRQKEETVVGTFRMKLEQDQVSGLISALRSTAFRDLIPPLRVVPGMAVRTLSILEPKKELVKQFAAAGQSTPPPFRVAEEAALQLVAVIRQKPLQTIASMGVVMPDHVARGSVVQTTLTLGNPGSVPVAIAAPSTWQGTGMRVMTVAVRSDIPPTKIMQQHQKFTPLSGSDVTHTSITPVEGRLVVSPGEQLVLTFSKLIDWAPGKYDAHLALMFTLTDGKGGGGERLELLTTNFPVLCEGEGDDLAESAPSGDDDEEPPDFVLEL